MRAFLKIECSQDCQLELWGLAAHEKAFAKVFKKRLVIESPGAHEAGE